MAEYNEYTVSVDGTGDFDSIGKAVAVAAAGDKIILRSGIYNESIEINKDVKITGEAGDNSEMPVISIESGVVCTVSSDAKISNIRFENSNSVEVDSGSRGLHSLVEVTGNAVFTDCEFYGSFDGNIKIMGNDIAPEFYNCNIYGAKRNGVFIVSGGKALFKKCEIHDNGFHGIAIVDSNPHIEDCKIYNIKGYCIIFIGSNDATPEEIPNPEVINCEIYDSKDFEESLRGVELIMGGSRIRQCLHGGILINNAKGYVKNCKFHDIKGKGLEIRNSEPVFEDCEIFNLQFEGDKIWGVNLTTSSSGQFKNCSIHDVNGCGVIVSEGSNPSFDDCEIYNCTRNYDPDAVNMFDKLNQEYKDFCEGINIKDNSTGSYKNCNIYKIEGSGIFVSEHARPVVKNCIIHDCEHEDELLSSGIFIRDNAKGTYSNCENYDISGNNTEFNIFVNDDSEQLDEEYDEDIDNFDIQNGILVKYKGDGELVRVPEGVTEIGNNAFCDLDNLKYVELPDTVTKLGNNAFSGSSIESIQLSENLTEIGDGCFSYTSISELELPDCLKKIGEKVFEFCNFDEFHIPKSLIDLSAFSFFNCKIDNISVDENNKKFTVIDGNLLSKDETIFYYHSNYKSDCKIPETIVEVEDFAFATTDIESVEFPDGIENIGKGTFLECQKLKSVVIPDSVKVIKEGAFLRSTLSKIKLPESLVTICSGAFTGCKFSSIYIPKNVKEIYGDSFCYCDNLECVNIDVNNENLTMEDNIIYTKDKKKMLYILPMADISEFFVPEGVQIICNSVFIHNNNLQKVVMSDTVTEIEHHAFYNCENLKSITLSENLKIIGDNAFGGDEKLTDLTIPESVTKIGKYAFKGCDSLKELSISDNVTEIGDGAFNITSNQIVIHGSTDSYIAEYAKKNALKFDTVIKGLNIIHDKLVSYDGNKEYFVVPNNITCIGRKAFTGCSCLKEINIHDRVTKIEANAFKGCTDITITGYPESFAAEYAAKYHLKFNPINITEKPVYMDKSTYGSAGDSGDYVLFGEWPQSKKSNSVTIDTEKVYNINGWKAYKGSDNYFYVYKKEKYSEKCHYIKIEPIKWRLLDNNYDGEGGKLLLCDSALYACAYYTGYESREVNGDTVELSNYEYSEVRASLNGLDGSDYGVSDYSGHGFIDMAFSTNARKIIKTTTVSNDGWSMLDSDDDSRMALEYTCKDTEDKVFLLSMAEVVKSKYGFEPFYVYQSFCGSSRQRFATNFAGIDGVETPCKWWLRSPSYTASVKVRFVNHNGDANWDGFANHPEYAVVPALVISDNNTKN